MTSHAGSLWLQNRPNGRSTLDVTTVESDADGNGAARRAEGAPADATDVARLRHEYETLLSLSATRIAEMEDLIGRKDALIAIASHDLKTPLTAILGYSQLVARLLASDAPKMDRVEHALAVIDREGRSMVRLLEALLDASRIQLGGLSLRPTPGDMEANVAAVIARMGPDECGRIDVIISRSQVAGRRSWVDGTTTGSSKCSPILSRMR